MIVPQLASGGCTPIDRKDSADSVSMLSAIIIGTKTMSVVETFGQNITQQNAVAGHAQANGGEHKFALAQ